MGTATFLEPLQRHPPSLLPVSRGVFLPPLRISSGSLNLLNILRGTGGVSNSWPACSSVGVLQMKGGTLSRCAAKSSAVGTN